MFLSRLSKRNKLILTISVFAVAFFLRSLIAYNFLVVDSDKLSQVSAAFSLIRGEGYTTPGVRAANIDSVIHTHLIQWPPVYSLALVPILKMTGYDVDLSCFIIDMIVALFFLSIFYLVLKLLNIPYWLRLLLLLYKGVEINDYVIYSNPTDLLGVSLWMVVIYSFAHFMKTQSRTFLWVMIILNALIPWFRYAYMPVTFVLPALMLFIWITSKNETGKPIIKVAALLSLSAIISVAALLLFNYANSGYLYYTVNANHGWYWYNLLYFGPVVWASFFDINFLLSQLSIGTGVPYLFWERLLRSINFFLFGGILIWLVYYLRKQRRDIKEQGVAYWFHLASGILAIGVLLSLAYVTVVNHRRVFGSVGGEWSYIEEPRYMLVVQLFIFMFICWQLFGRKYASTSTVLKIFRTAFLLVICLQTLHGFWFSAKIINGTAIKMANQTNWKETILFLDKMRERAKNEKVQLLLAGRNLDYKAYGGIHNLGVMINPLELNSIPICSDQPKLLLFRIKKGHESLYNDFLGRKDVRRSAVVNDFYFYEYYVPSCDR